MRGLLLLLASLLAACSGSSGAESQALKAKRLEFAGRLNFLTYRSQCPDVTPLILSSEQAEVEKLKDELRARIVASPLAAEYRMSDQEMQRHHDDPGNNESDCVGIPYKDDDQEAISQARRGFVIDKSKIARLEAQFQSLLKQIDKT